MAALDFPASPTINQTYTANGLTYTWDGTSWVTTNPTDVGNATGTLAVLHGGNGQTSYINGQLLIGNTTGNTLTKTTLTAGAGITVTNGSGAITIANSTLGTVTTVGFTGGIVSVANPTTDPALTVAGTSGGVPYFSSGTTWATSAALAANALVVGGGAGASPSTVTTGANVLTALGVAIGSAGAPVTFNGALGTPTSGNLSNCTGIQYNGFKNKIIGGDFTINPWQRGTSFVAVANGVVTADRWWSWYVSAAVNTMSKATDAPTATEAGIYTQSCLSIACTTVDSSIAAGDYWSIYQGLEGYNTASFGFGQTGTRYVTLSFWVKGTKTGIHSVALQNNAANRSYVAEYTINVTNTWEYKTITIAVDTTGTWENGTSAGIYLYFALMCGTTFKTTAGAWAAGAFLASSNQVNAMDANTNVFKIALIQLEAGQVATAYDVRSVQQELALCQRYYQTRVLRVPATATPASIPINMRAIPTIAGGGAGFASTNTTADTLTFSQTTNASNTITLQAEL
jgi:hypothetical protein